MSLRYIVRRPKPEDLTELKSRVSDLDKQLGAPDKGLLRTVPVKFSPLRFANYMLATRKVGEEWKWVCPTIEFDVEGEEGLLAMSQTFQFPWPSHLPHPTKSN